MRPVCVITLCLLGCAAAPADPREAIVVQALVDADEVLLRTRPELMAGKYRRMAGTPFDFFRGNLPIAVADWEAGRTSGSGFGGTALPVLGLGDPHPENFGLLLGRDGTFTFEPNDFDGAGAVPFLFDVRRLVTGLAVATRARSPKASPELVARAAAEAWVTRFLALADGAAPEPITGAGDSKLLEDVFSRGRRDLLARAELRDLTVVDEHGARRFLRGAPDESEPTGVLEDLHPDLVASIPEALARLPNHGAILDVVRQLGSGVASWPRLRILVLLDGPTAARDDDVIVELKELTEAPTAAWFRPWAVATDTPQRVEAALRRAWFRPDADPRWHTTTWRGLPLQVRTESEANKGLKTSRWAGARAAEEELVKLGAVLGGLLARVHFTSSRAAVDEVRAQLLRDPERFALEQSNFAAVQSEAVLADYAVFLTALETLGPTLGVQPDVRELPVGLPREVFGAP